MSPRDILGTYVELERYIVRIRSLCLFFMSEWSDMDKRETLKQMDIVQHFGLVNAQNFSLQ